MSAARISHYEAPIYDSVEPLRSGRELPLDPGRLGYTMEAEIGYSDYSTIECLVVDKNTTTLERLDALHLSNIAKDVQHAHIYFVPYTQLRVLKPMTFGISRLAFESLMRHTEAPDALFNVILDNNGAKTSYICHNEDALGETKSFAYSMVSIFYFTRPSLRVVLY